MAGWKFVLLFAVGLLVVFLLLCQDTQNGGAPPAPVPVPVQLLPGERNDPSYRQPIIESVFDGACALDTICPSRRSDCVTKSFVAQKDTVYHLYAVYANGDTTQPSCVLCASLYHIRAAGDTVLVTSIETACPTGGPWADHPRLAKDSTYMLSACLHKCGDMSNCQCGEMVDAFAIVSMRDLLDELKRHFR
ncbi:MAG: hypothetical protein IPK53_01975 [bacterium]|nr:hypothetical protein [bacterium]MBK8127733.1 hypothetical protein [bacterium]